MEHGTAAGHWIRLSSRASIVVHLVLHLLSIALSACAGSASASGQSPARGSASLALIAVRDEVVADQATTGDAGDERARRLIAPTPGARTARATRLMEWLARLHGVSPTALASDDERLSYSVLLEALEAERDLQICHSELWTVNHYSGWQVRVLGHLGDPVGSAEERAAILQYWASLPAFLRAEKANLRSGLDSGYSAPKRTVELVLTQLDGVLAVGEKAALDDPARRSDDVPFRESWRALVRDSLRPAIATYVAYLRASYLPRARAAISLRENRDGVACYAALLRHYVTRPLTGEGAYAEGTRIVAHYDSLIAARGDSLYGTSARDSITVLLASTPRFSSRDELLAYTDTVLGRARAAVPRFFGRVSTAPLVLRTVPEYLEATAPPARYEMAERRTGASAPPVAGTYLVNAAHPERQDRRTIERTSFHEGYPGHHLQMSIAGDRESSVAGIGGLNSGFIEGWARYAEALAEEMGLYRVPGATIARLLWPAHGIVLDAGIHSRGWTRAEALAYMSTVSPRGQAGNEQLVDRVVAIPGQLASYDLGAAEFFSLRAAAETALGPRFDLRAFHDQLLGYGVIPLAVLHQRVMRWIAAAANDTTPARHP